MPDQAHRSPLDPARGVDARHALVRVRMQHLAFVVGDDTVALIEGDPRQGRPEVADGTVQRLQRQLADLAGADHATLAVGPGPLPPEAGHPAVVTDEDLEGLGVEVEMKSP